MKNNHFPSICALEGPILVTGHTGFKGAWLSILLDTLEIPFYGLSLPPEKDSLYLRADLSRGEGEAFLDINDAKGLHELFQRIKPSAVIHMAAQPLVLKSYEYPLQTFQTNVIGTANLLQASLEVQSVRSFIGITTDKVYRNDNSGRRFIESDPLEGKDPYSASKVGSESALAAWRQISSLNQGPSVLSVRAGNVIGGGDFAENRIIPDLIRAISSNSVVDIRNPESSRPWQHVLDPLFGYLMALEFSLANNADFSPMFNFGPDTESLRVSDVVKGFKEVFSDNLRVNLRDSANKKLESTNLDLDSSYANSLLGWKPRWTQEESIRLTADWWNKVLNKEVSAKQACQTDVRTLLDAH